MSKELTEKSPASPLAGDFVAKVFNGLADFPARSSNGLLHPAFCTFLMTALMQIGIVQSLTKFLFDRSANLLAFAFQFVFVTHNTTLLLPSARVSA